MLIVILAVLWILIELFIALGLITSVTVQSCAIIALVGFVIIGLVAIISGPAWPNWFNR